MNNFSQIKIYLNLIEHYRYFFYETLSLRQPFFVFNENEISEIADENMLKFLKKRYVLKKKETKTFLFYMLKRIITKMKMKAYFKKEIITFKKFLDKTKKNDMLFLKTTQAAVLVKKKIEKFFSTKKSNLRTIKPYIEFTFLR